MKSLTTVLTLIFSIYPLKIALAGDRLITDEVEFREVVAIASSKGVCSGLLISDRFVITADHCLSGGEMVVIAKPFQSASEAATTTVDKMAKVARSWSYQDDRNVGSARNIAHDLALLELESPFWSGNFFSATQMTYSSSINLSSGESLSFVGYGNYKKHLATAGIASSDKNHFITATNFNLNHGDSGGVLFTTRNGAYVATGICSGDYNHVTKFAKIDQDFVNWMVSKVGSEANSHDWFSHASVAQLPVAVAAPATIAVPQPVTQNAPTPEVRSTTLSATVKKGLPSFNYHNPADVMTPVAIAKYRSISVGANALDFS